MVDQYQAGNNAEMWLIQALGSERRRFRVSQDSTSKKQLVLVIQQNDSQAFGLQVVENTFDVFILLQPAFS